MPNLPQKKELSSALMWLQLGAPSIPIKDVDPKEAVSILKDSVQFLLDPPVDSFSSKFCHLDEVNSEFFTFAGNLGGLPFYTKLLELWVQLLPVISKSYLPCPKFVLDLDSGIVCLNWSSCLGFITFKISSNDIWVESVITSGKEAEQSVNSDIGLLGISTCSNHTLRFESNKDLFLSRLLYIFKP